MLRIDYKEYPMEQELIDFNYFKDNQLHYFNKETGQLDVMKRNKKGVYSISHICKDVGSKNDDGYIRIWCNKKLRMKHRLIYFLVHNILPKKGYEIDHKDNCRDNNSVANLRILSKANNNKTTARGKQSKQLTSKQTHLICKLLQDTSLSDLKISLKMNKSRGTIRDIKTRRTWRSISDTYTWNHRIK